MSYSQVWTLLHDRTDLTHLLRELLGQYAIATQAKDQDDLEAIRALTFHLFVHIRLIFDLQHSHLQPEFPFATAEEFIVPAPSILSIICYLVQLQSNIPVNGSLDPEIHQARCFAARTLMKGLRVLSLMDFKIPQQDAKRLSNGLEHWSSKRNGSDLEVFLLEKCQQSIRHISRSTGFNDQKSPSSKSRRLSLNVGEIFKQELRHLRDGDECSFWTLFDILWATKAGDLQNPAGESRYRHEELYPHPVDLLCSQLSDDNVDEICLKTELTEWCHQGGDAATQKAQNHKRSISQPYTRFHHANAIEGSLKDLKIYLEHRQSSIFIASSEVRQLDDEFENFIKEWFEEASRIDKLEEKYQKVLQESSPTIELGDMRTEITDAFILSCPDQHVIPAFWLRNLMGKKEGIQISPKTTFIKFRTDIACPCCESDRVIIESARRIGPLHQIFKKLHSRIQEPQIESNQTQLVEDGKVDSDELPSSASLTTESLRAAIPQKRDSRITFREGEDNSSSGGSMITSSRLSEGTKSSRKFSFGFGKKKPHEPSLNVKLPKKDINSISWSHTFSKDNASILLWGPESKYIFASAIYESDQNGAVEKWTWKSYSVSGASLVAGAGGRVAAITENSNLIVYFDPGNDPVVDIHINAKSPRSIAISNQGNVVAVGFEACVVVYRIGAGSEAEEVKRDALNTDDKWKFNSQQLNFNREGTGLVVATRTSRQSETRVDVSVCDWMHSERSWRRQSSSGSLTDKDWGLSAAFIDDGLRRAVLAGYSSKAYSMVHSHSGEELNSTSNSKGSERRFQAAAQHPSGSSVTLVTANGHLLQLDLKHKPPSIRDLNKDLEWKEPPKSSNDFISLAIPDEQTLFAFKIEKDLGVLSIIRDGSRTPKPKRRRIQLPDASLASFEGTMG